MKQFFLSMILFWAGTLMSSAQWFPSYNPYYNTGAALGNAIGQGIRQNQTNSRNKLRKEINKWGSCQNGTLTIKHGAVAVYGGYGYFCSATVPDAVKDKMKEINKKRSVINDVNITEGGYYIIVYDGGEMWWGHLPSAVLNKLKSLPSSENIWSVSFNDSGTYAIVTESHVYSNFQDYQNFHEEKREELGLLRSVNICGNGAVFCYEKGSDFCGTIPENVSRVIKDCSFTPRFVKFNNRGDYLICSKSGSVKYQIYDVDKSSVASTVTKKPGPRRVKSELVDEFYFNSYGQAVDGQADFSKIFVTPEINGESVLGEYAVRFDFKSTPGHILVEYKLMDRMDNSVKEKTTFDIMPEKSNFYENKAEKLICIFFPHEGEVRGVFIIKNTKQISIVDTMKGNKPNNWKSYSSISEMMKKVTDLNDFKTFIASYAGLVEGFNRNKNFEHGFIHTENEDFDERYEKLLSELSRYPWKK